MRIILMFYFEYSPVFKCPPPFMKHPKFPPLHPQGLLPPLPLNNTPCNVPYMIGLYYIPYHTSCIYIFLLFYNGSLVHLIVFVLTMHECFDTVLAQVLHLLLDTCCFVPFQSAGGLKMMNQQIGT